MLMALLFLAEAHPDKFGKASVAGSVDGYGFDEKRSWFQTRGVSLLQATTRFLAFEPGVLPVRLKVDTGIDPDAGTETGADVSFKVGGSWTENSVLCQRAKLGEAVFKTYNLTAWPSELRISARGSDAWGYTRIQLRWANYVITVLDEATGNLTDNSGSTNWVDGNEASPVVNVYPVSKINVPPDSPEVYSATMEDLQSKKLQPSYGHETQCTTRYDPRARVIGYTTSPPGTPCVFGVDPRDEGFHCILDDSTYGSLGWCYTSSGKSRWGSCGEQCPLFGQAAKLEKQLKDLHARLRNITDCGNGGSATPIHS